MNASTDMGNVSRIISSLHGAFVIQAKYDVSAHNPAFAACSGTEGGQKAAVNSAKGMAMLALRVLVDEQASKIAKEGFKRDYW